MTDDFDLFSKETRRKATLTFLFNLLIYGSILYFEPSRFHLMIGFSFVIVGMVYYRMRPIENGQKFAKEVIKSLMYLYIFVAVVNFIALRLLIYGVMGYAIFIILYVVFVLYRRRKLFVSGIDQILVELKKVKKVREVENGKENNQKSSNELNQSV